jgi:hypothetical protein
MSKIIVIGTAIAGLGDDISNMTIIGTNPMVSILVVYDEAVTTNVYIQECYFTGILDGGTILRNCVVGNTHYFDGFIENCAIAADVIAINGTGTFINCREGNKVLSDFVIDMTTGDNLFVRDFSGDMVIANKTTDGIVEIKIDGKVTIHPSCTAGTYNIYGDGHVVNLSNVIVNDKTTGSPQEIADAIWSSTTRELTSAGAGGTTAQEVWEYGNRTLTDVDLTQITTELEDIQVKLGLLSNYNDTELVSLITGLETLTEDERAKLLSLENYDDAVVLARVNTLPVLADIENSSVLAKKSDINLVEQIVNALPVMSDIRDELVNVVHGSLEISNNQMIVKDKDGIILSIFGLKDRNGNPSMTTVFKRDVVQ